MPAVSSSAIPHSITSASLLEKTFAKCHVFLSFRAKNLSIFAIEHCLLSFSFNLFLTLLFCNWEMLCSTCLNGIHNTCEYLLLFHLSSVELKKKTIKSCTFLPFIVQLFLLYCGREEDVFCKKQIYAAVSSVLPVRLITSL